MIGVGDLVRWRRDHYPKTSPDPFPVIAVYDDGETVRLEGGATAPARMLEVVEIAAPAEGDAGLLQVIEAQMAEIDRLRGELDDASQARSDADDDLAKVEARAEDVEHEYGQDVTGLVGQLCIALGFDRHPGLPTGIPELDALVRYVMD